MSPLFDFSCPMCEDVKEDIFKKFNSNIAEVCPKCGAVMNQLVGKVNFCLEGKGWAKDLYSKD